MTTLRNTRRIGYPGKAFSEIEPLMFEPEYPIDMVYQEEHIREIIHPLRFHLRWAGDSRTLDPDIFVSSATLVFYDPDDMNARLTPDCAVAFDVDVPYIRQRDGYVIWEMGKPPDFVLEVASPTTADEDLGHKRAIYEQRMAVPEYWRFDRSGGRLYGQALAGDRLVNGVYRPIEITTEPDGVVWGYSEMLGLSLCYVPDYMPEEEFTDDLGMLLFFDRETGQYLMTGTEEHIAYEESQAQLEESRANLQAERATRERQRAELEAEQAIRERQRAELEAERARVRELEEELRRRESGEGPPG